MEICTTLPQKPSGIQGRGRARGRARHHVSVGNESPRPGVTHLNTVSNQRVDHLNTNSNHLEHISKSKVNVMQINSSAECRKPGKSQLGQAFIKQEQMNGIPCHKSLPSQNSFHSLAECNTQVPEMSDWAQDDIPKRERPRFDKSAVMSIKRYLQGGSLSPHRSFKEQRIPDLSHNSVCSESCNFSKHYNAHVIAAPVIASSVSPSSTLSNSCTSSLQFQEQPQSKLVGDNCTNSPPRPYVKRLARGRGHRSAVNCDALQPGVLTSTTSTKHVTDDNITVMKLVEDGQYQDVEIDCKHTTHTVHFSISEQSAEKSEQFAEILEPANGNGKQPQLCTMVSDSSGTIPSVTYIFQRAMTMNKSLTDDPCIESPTKNIDFHEGEDFCTRQEVGRTKQHADNLKTQTDEKQRQHTSNLKTQTDEQQRKHNSNLKTQTDEKQRKHNSNLKTQTFEEERKHTSEFSTECDIPLTVNFTEITPIKHRDTHPLSLTISDEKDRPLKNSEKIIPQSPDGMPTPADYVPVLDWAAEMSTPLSPISCPEWATLSATNNG